MTQVAAVVLLAVLAPAGEAAPLTAAERRGRELFRRGESAAGRSVEVTLNGEPTPLAFACAGCHGRDGRGRPEGGFRPADLRAETLRRALPAEGSRPARPAYDRARLLRAITLGIDPGGRRLDALMPRYRLWREDADDLLAYLDRLGTLTDPGLAPDAVRVGVFLAGERRRDDARRAVEAWATELSARGGVYARRPEVVLLDDVDLPALDEEREPFVVVGRPAAQTSAALAAWVAAREVPWLRASGAGEAPAGPWTVDLRAPAGDAPAGVLGALTDALARIGRDASREGLLRALR